MMRISEKALLRVVGYEVGGKQNYEQRLTHPTWPEGASGVTIGIGCDLGYLTRKEFTDMWSPYIAADMIDALLPACGVKGQPAQALAAQLRDEVMVPWEVAFAVYEDRMVPRHEAATILAFPGSERLHPDCFGALFNLVLNRGPSMGHPGDDRRQEMRLIRQAIIANDLTEVPALIRGMKRLWVGDPDMRGLLDRREDEARLFEEGLLASGVALERDTAPVAQPLRTLRVGMSGDDVRKLQERLNGTGAKLATDGQFGPATKRAVEMFQYAENLPADGIVGPVTAARLKLL